MSKAKRSGSVLGKWGEDQAVAYLEERGFTILHRNFRWARGELDVVARQDNLLVFIEVKTATNYEMGDPATWVTRRKQLQIGKVALKYLQDHAITGLDCRFDVIGVVKQGDDAKINHIENAFWL